VLLLSGRIASSKKMKIHVKGIRTVRPDEFFRRLAQETWDRRLPAAEGLEGNSSHRPYSL
jgi:hypothetical protein